MIAKFDKVTWYHFNLETGKEIKSGIEYLSNKTCRLVGPGVNNILISRLRKGEHVVLLFPSLNLKAEFKPEKSAW